MSGCIIISMNIENLKWLIIQNEGVWIWSHKFRKIETHTYVFDLEQLQLVISGGASKHRPRFFFLGARRWRREHYKARRRRRRGPVRLLLLQPRLRPAEPPSSSSLAPTRASQPKPPGARIGFRFPISPRRAPAAGTPTYSLPVLLSIQESSGSKNNVQ
jgi:hypothetical protein